MGENSNLAILRKLGFTCHEIHAENARTRLFMVGVTIMNHEQLSLFCIDQLAQKTLWVKY